jgi:TPR repeat protein
MAQDRAALNAMFLQANQLESRDPAGANRLYDEAARQGHTPSMVMLGYRLIHGTGQPQDLSRAFSFFTAATKAGDLDGQFPVCSTHQSPREQQFAMDRSKSLRASSRKSWGTHRMQPPRNTTSIARWICLPSGTLKATAWPRVVATAFRPAVASA